MVVDDLGELEEAGELAQGERGVDPEDDSEGVDPVLSLLDQATVNLGVEQGQGHGEGA